MSRAASTEIGYLMSEEQHNQVMRGIDSLRFMEGMVSTACSAKVTPCFDLEDLAGYLQLLLEHTYAPMKSLEFERWSRVVRAVDPSPLPPKADSLAPAEEEDALLRDYRAMEPDDRKHLRRVAEALAFMAASEG
ncbi:hypothetical protein [Stutzerimonas kunmingensis]|uniref:hypothetical protein n=1 Tax=Stutzerimonas kunmingensis TaxID=1211807 RepID=UPI0028AB27A5|nr:hypothetical protein [Stutzerimonas kunmingensis]